MLSEAIGYWKPLAPPSSTIIMILPKTTRQFGAILGPQDAGILLLGPKWGHEKSWEKPRIAAD